MKSYVVADTIGCQEVSTLTKDLATKYANRYPNRKVVMIDLCPQVNLTKMILGDNFIKQYTLNNQSIVDYLYNKVGIVDEYNLNKLIVYSADLPSNLGLVVCCPKLAMILHKLDKQEFRACKYNKEIPKQWLKELMVELVAKLGEDITFFIDCETQLNSVLIQAISITDKIIICNRDHGSRVWNKYFFESLLDNKVMLLFNGSKVDMLVELLSEDESSLDLLISNELS